ncbi:MAG TPA: Tm-1-like ATP-binding domain-containing protein, partial [Pirellulales bacterium]|nr:Tm-1-like ATP-binding domain-containing protein [Pirellulales bacterium]
MSVYLLATLDTKGQEADYVRSLLTAAKVDVRLVDTGCLGTPSVAADIAREAVFAAGGASLAELAAKNDRGLAVTAAADGAAK